MLFKIILLITILSYSAIVAQSFMYIIALKKVQYKMQAASYIELRKFLDAAFNATYKFAVYAALLSNIALLVVTGKNYFSIFFVTSCLAFGALIMDVLLALKGNMPINKQINTWAVDSYPEDWADYRAEWLQIFQYRQVVTITGFIILLAGVVFGLY
ncbi:hypothetical protein [Ferruginibacter sp. SUN106]|uniref:hypothetical protein n=1 Tax=Ferruginibacter sp. SUN106 TaxID=2978348 RepID=UPI003D35D600